MADAFIALVSMMTLSQEDLECFVGGRDVVIEELRNRLIPYKGQRRMMSKT